MVQFNKESLELQIADIDLLCAAYPDGKELVVDSSTIDEIDSLRNWTLDGGPRPVKIPSAISCTLHVRLDTKSVEELIQLNIEFDLTSEDEADPLSTKRPKVQLRQPEWMTKSALTKILLDMPKDFDSILYVIDYIRDSVTTYYNENATMQKQQVNVETKQEQQQLVRVWFYFPSLSTREKRDDLVNHAPSFGLTGFVLAGKPGLLCLEGQAPKVDAYMKFIKTESWGDIPSHHKKVSERFREAGDDIKRHFTNMCEITDQLGEKRGERGNRSDMKVLEAWLVDKGLGQAFSHVLM